MKNPSATIRNIKVSPKKLSIMASAIRGKSLEDAYWIVRNSKKGYSEYFIHALSNAEAIMKEKSAQVSEAKVSNVRVDQGARLKRFRPGSRGYSYTYKHALSHLTVELKAVDIPEDKMKNDKKTKPTKKLRRPKKSVEGTESRSKESGEK